MNPAPTAVTMRTTYAKLKPSLRWPGWRSEACTHCRGYGLVSDCGGGDFEGAKDCPDCNNGTVWVSPKGRHALWPGGAFTGGRTTPAA